MLPLVIIEVVVVVGSSVHDVWVFVSGKLRYFTLTLSRGFGYGCGNSCPSDDKDRDQDGNAAADSLSPLDHNKA